jgi:hypothetical protein
MKYKSQRIHDFTETMKDAGLILFTILIFLFIITVIMLMTALWFKFIVYPIFGLL